MNARDAWPCRACRQHLHNNHVKCYVTCMQINSIIKNVNIANTFATFLCPKTHTECRNILPTVNVILEIART